MSTPGFSFSVWAIQRGNASGHSARCPRRGSRGCRRASDPDRPRHRAGAADRVAGGAAIGEKVFAALRGERLRGLGRGLPLLREPLRERRAFPSPRRRRPSARAMLPQYSAHTPRKVPVRVGSSASRVRRPGIMSIFPPSAGIQNEWITSGLSSSNSTGSPTGRRISFASTTSPPSGDAVAHAPPPLLAGDRDPSGFPRARAPELRQHREPVNQQPREHHRRHEHAAADDQHFACRAFRSPTAARALRKPRAARPRSRQRRRRPSSTKTTPRSAPHRAPPDRAPIADRSNLRATPSERRRGSSSQFFSSLSLQNRRLSFYFRLPSASQRMLCKKSSDPKPFAAATLRRDRSGGCDTFDHGDSLPQSWSASLLLAASDAIPIVKLRLHPCGVVTFGFWSPLYFQLEIGKHHL